MAEIADSPASMITIFGAIPGLVGCVFPICVFFAIVGEDGDEPTRPTPGWRVVARDPRRQR